MAFFNFAKLSYRFALMYFPFGKPNQCSQISPVITILLSQEKRGQAFLMSANSRNDPYQSAGSLLFILMKNSSGIANNHNKESLIP